MREQLIDVAVPATPRRFFTYRWGERTGHMPSPGQRLLVPLGKRKVIGYFIARASSEPEMEIKSVIDAVEPETLFNSELYDFLTWMSEYYLANIADVLSAALPPEMRKLRKPSFLPGPGFETFSWEDDGSLELAGLIKEKGQIYGRAVNTMERKYPGLIERLATQNVLQATYTGILRNTATKDFEADFDYFKSRPETKSLLPNSEQTEAIWIIKEGLGRFSPFLLYGITGSGKTLVYCHAAREVLSRGNSVLVLVPEIALAGTLLSYFKSYFKDDIALVHSSLRPKERLMIWQGIKNGRYKIVIGARSAISSPLHDLGLIIVDEEHDESYKQDDPSPRFQGRDAAVMRARMANIPIVLGSASPSVESFYNAQSGRYRLMRLSRRPEAFELPLVRVVDLKKESLDTDNLFFTRTMTARVKRSLRNKEQVILYLNRRGFSPRIKCLDCGHTPICPHCELHLTYHRAGNKLMCHFCGYVDADYNRCASCQGENFIYIGTGTQKIEDKIGELFPDARMVRLDSDSAAGRDRANLILSNFASGKYNLLLGTQMVTKGIDFPKVSLVGVLMADIGMDMPDFRASEKLFSKLIQVAGRSGRGIVPGEVVIQTFNPETDLIDDAARQDYDTFYSREISSRKHLGYPPFRRLVNFRFSSRGEDILRRNAVIFRDRLQAGIKNNTIDAELLGPAPCPLYRLRGSYRRHLFVKTGQIGRLTKFLTEWERLEAKFGLSSKVKMVIDIDPYDMM